MDEIRPRLRGDIESWERLISLAKDSSPRDVLERLLGKSHKRELEQDIQKGSARELFTVENPPTCLEDMLEHSKVNLDEWQVSKYLVNHWAGFYQVKIWFDRKEESRDELIRQHIDKIKSSFRKVESKKINGSGVGVLALADFHYGMDFKGDNKNSPFNIKSLTSTLSKVADKINRMSLKEVHLVLLGDFIESFTGLNHLDTWKHLSSYGITAAKGITELIRDELVLKINNVSEVYIIAGNHDRISPKKDIDSKGEAAKLIAEFLELMVNIPVSFDYSYLNPEIDGIKYILTHGDLGLSKKDEYQTILEYGNQNIYNVMLQGHEHRRHVKKGVRLKRNITTNTVSLEGSNFRKIIVPPLVTGGAFSSSLGLFGSAGMTLIMNNGSNGVDHYDFSC